MSDQPRLVTRIYALVGDKGDTPLTLDGTTRIVPDGYTLNAAESYLQDDDLANEFKIICAVLDFTEAKTPDELFDMALAELKERTQQFREWRTQQ